MRLLDRYIVQNFIVPFFYCFFGFIAIWFVFDLADNFHDFLDAQMPILKIGYYYAAQLPQILVLALPIDTLLALLYCLSRMSRSNEIIAQLTAGRSLVRIITPLLVAGLIITVVSQILNFQLSPHSEARKKQIMAQITNSKKEQQQMSAQLFRNRQDSRTWYVQRMNVKRNQIEGVQVIQQDAEGNPTESFYAARATYDPATKTWTLERGKTIHYAPNGNIKSSELWINGADASRKITGWSETPWRISSANLDASAMSAPELRDYLRFNADFPTAALAPYRTHLADRFALPWQCFVILLLAAPLGIVYSRRGVLGGVLTAIAFCFALIFVNSLALALGKGNRLPPEIAAWGANITFGIIGALLVYMRSFNVELPTFKTLFAGRKS